MSYREVYQQALRERRRAAGIRQYVFWLTSEQAGEGFVKVTG
jgi:hypothetical protein